MPDLSNMPRNQVIAEAYNKARELKISVGVGFDWESRECLLVSKSGEERFFQIYKNGSILLNSPSDLMGTEYKGSIPNDIVEVFSEVVKASSSINSALVKINGTAT